MCVLFYLLYNDARISAFFTVICTYMYTLQGHGKIKSVLVVTCGKVKGKG